MKQDTIILGAAAIALFLFMRNRQQQQQQQQQYIDPETGAYDTGTETGGAQVPIYTPPAPVAPVIEAYQSTGPSRGNVGGIFGDEPALQSNNSNRADTNYCLY